MKKVHTGSSVFECAIVIATIKVEIKKKHV